MITWALYPHLSSLPKSSEQCSSLSSKGLICPFLSESLRYVGLSQAFWEGWTWTWHYWGKSTSSLPLHLSSPVWVLQMVGFFLSLSRRMDMELVGNAWGASSWVSFLLFSVMKSLVAPIKVKKPVLLIVLLALLWSWAGHSSGFALVSFWLIAYTLHTTHNRVKSCFLYFISQYTDFSCNHTCKNKDNVGTHSEISTS